MNWGLKLFADTDSTCGVSPNNVAVPDRRQQRGAVANVIQQRTDANGGVTNGSRTPTRSAENAAVTYLNTVTTSNPKFILLATDGQPNCARQRQPPTRTTRRGRSWRLPTRRPPAFRPSSSASRPPPARRTTRST